MPRLQAICNNCGIFKQINGKGLCGCCYSSQRHRMLQLATLGCKTWQQVADKLNAFLDTSIPGYDDLLRKHNIQPPDRRHQKKMTAAQAKAIFTYNTSD